MSGFRFSSSSSSTHQFSPFCSTSSSSSSNSVFPSISPPSSGLFFGSFSSNPSSSSTSFAFGSPKFTSSSSTTTSNLFGSATLSSVSATSPAVFGSSSSNSISTGTSSAPFFSSNLFVSSSSSSSSSSPSFPNLFGSSSFPAISAPAFSFASSVSNAGSSSSSFSYTNTPASSHPGLSLSTETSAPASSGQPQSTAVAPLFGPPFPIDGSCSATSLEADLGDREEEDDGVEEVYIEFGQGRGGLAKQVTVAMAEQEAVVPGLRTDQEEESQKVMKMEGSSVQESHENETNPSVVSISADSISKLQPAEAIVDTPNASMAELNGGKEVQLAQDDAPICVEGEGKSGVASTVIAGDEGSAHGTGSQTFCVSAPFIYVNGFCISSQNGMIVQQIFEKYGDITKGSKIKSVAAKSGFLELVADTVQRLCNHTMKSLGLDELQFIEQHTGDALAVGFNVNWLHQRVEKIISASDYHLHLMELDKLAKQIDDAKKSLMEMELRQMICMQEVAAIKGEMEENGFGESNLGEGLL
ncbi:uncharacterized protein DDB_G0271670-like isoform X1 [Camellia sinensis]|uniref:Uncharacterized protein n=1 Tax=Camellia sinensis var. sinensis TaxID=542762 RepID=A0A4S4EPB2_CAMSN|nr:uncharacterized protein DDB_G0271670-like isoform X1 [Camellia sinensis]THG18570.1 hypothetical protein TEA_010850 [Camellia sinensis var. sinensis]